MAGLDRRAFLKTAGAGAVACWLGADAWAAEERGARARKKRPNIVYILCDDLGYGDVHCFNEQGKIPTPNIDRLAAQGVRFTDAHSGSAVCSPTRYGIMTGRYSWRSTMKSGVLYTNSPPLIPTSRMTVASLLKKSGYRTACIGKWHLGLGFKTTDGRGPQVGNLDYGARIKGGPCALGFDYYFGIPASLDMEDYFYIENDRVVQPPTRRVEGEKAPRYYRPGLMAEDFTLEGVLPTLTDKAIGVIDRHARDHKRKPLFLYLPLTAPHAPVVPNEEYKGQGKVGVYGDFVTEIDAAVGQVLDAIERNHMTRDTLVVFTSDNGFAPVAGLENLLDQGHNPSYVFRGHKADVFEGGHRIPFIARWPKEIDAGSTCDDTICLADLMATAAEIVGKKIPDDAAEDSVSFLPALLGQSSRPGREATVHHSANGSFAIRQGNWKLVFCPDSGGWSKPTPKEAKTMNLPRIQLYDLDADIGEKNNVYAEHPEIVERLTKLMQCYIDRGRSTPGKPQSNEGKIWLYRADAANE